MPRRGSFFAVRRAIGDRAPEETAGARDAPKSAGQWAQMVALSKQDRAIAHRQIKAAEASDAFAFAATVNAIAATDQRLGKLALSSGFHRSSPCSAIL